MKNPRLVTVEWRDILGTAGWEKPDEVNPPVITTIGYLIQKNKDVVKIATPKMRRARGLESQPSLEDA